MFAIVAWLLLFRMKEVMECWRIDTRMPYCFCLNLFGTAVDVGIGICNTVFVIGDMQQPRLPIWSWVSTYIHVALDTCVLYDVLREKNMDKRGVDGWSANNCNSIANSSGLVLSR
ncbi:unnamed protein product [Ectocarpus fasciculatus]